MYKVIPIEAIEKNYEGTHKTMLEQDKSQWEIEADYEKNQFDKHMRSNVARNVYRREQEDVERDIFLLGAQKRKKSHMKRKTKKTHG